MSSDKKPVIAPGEEIPRWQRDLDQIGFWRRLLLARKWYGADWWFVVLSGILLLFIFSMAFFPGLYAPFDPRAESGPGLLAPGELPPDFVIVGKTGEVSSLDDLVGRDVEVGLILDEITASSQILREQAEARQEELRAAGQTDAYLHPTSARFATHQEAFEAIQNDEVLAVVTLRQEAEAILADYPGIQIGEDLTGTNQGAFVLGTNQIGQDVLSRIIWGTRIALLVGFLAALTSLVVGVPLGLIAGYWTGWMERILTLVMDSLYSFPGLILAIAISAVLGPGVMNVIVAIAVLYVPTYYRIVRGQTMAIKEELYVEAGRSLGAHAWDILIHYIFPNVIPSIAVIFSVNVADAILTEAGLSFIGLGLPPDTPDWGIDLAAGQDHLTQAWWLVTYPGLMIVIVTLGFSMLGESLSEILNPRLTER